MSQGKGQQKDKHVNLVPPGNLGDVIIDQVDYINDDAGTPRTFIRVRQLNTNQTHYVYRDGNETTNFPLQCILLSTVSIATTATYQRRPHYQLTRPYTVVVTSAPPVDPSTVHTPSIQAIKYTDNNPTGQTVQVPVPISP